MTTMGREAKQLTVTATVSNHNSEQDNIDDGLWDMLANRIAEVCADPVFKPISPMVF